MSHRLAWPELGWNLAEHNRLIAPTRPSIKEFGSRASRRGSRTTGGRLTGTSCHSRAGMRWVRTGLTAILICLPLAACMNSERPQALPYSARDTAQVPDFGFVRFWGDQTSPAIDAYVDRQLLQVRASGCGTCLTTASFLALSGGGDDGAFAAGLLNGWSLHGDRPDFEVVTGVSTGSLAAPFAFLGARYDAQLKEVYTQIDAGDIYTDNGLAGLAGASLYDSGPLRKLVGDLVTPALLDAIAREHRKGRRLLVQTTNIDAQRPVMWDLGAIASSPSPARQKLFVDILVASAAIPAVFPPVSVKVRTESHDFEELHVDGGVTSQITFGPPGLELNKAERRIFGHTRTKNLYVIRNGKLRPEYFTTRRNLADLAKRSVATLVKYQTLANIRNLAARAKKMHINLRFSAIPEIFSEKPTHDFDRAYMSRVFNLGLELAAKGDFWLETPPDSPIMAETMSGSR